MNQPVKTLSDEERLKLAELARIKRLATAVLILCFLVMIGARMLAAKYPPLAFVAAFAEAATIGGIADWYAVVALFKRPMGLPIPHTAIIPANQIRIADNLGLFIERNFLSRDTVGEKLREIDFADEIAGWLSDRKRSGDLARFIAKMVPQLLETVDESGLRKFVTDRAKAQVERTEIAPIAANLLDAFVKDGRHEQLMDELLGALHKFLNDKKALEIIRHKVQEELPSLLYILQAEDVILRRIVKAASHLLEEVRTDPEHELRDEFERFLKRYVRHIKRSKRFAVRVERMKSEILARPELANMAESMWRQIRSWLEKDVVRDDSQLVARLTDIFVDTGRKLADETELKKEIDAELVRILSELVESQKSAVSTFIADQVKGWDFAQLTLLIEANVGKDLQYIRFNGMIIGGIAGLTLHIAIAFIGGI